MNDLATLTIHTDGASRGNPGAAACAYVIGRPGAAPIEEAARLGEMTNNQAEYNALVRALRHALKLGAAHHVHVLSDSELMVKQMRGEYRVKNEDLRDLYEEAQDLRRQFRGQVTFAHIPRAENSRADALCNEALDGKRPALAVEPEEGAAPRGNLRQQAVDRLLHAAAAWSAGASEPTPDTVWGELVQLLRRHGVKVPR